MRFHPSEFFCGISGACCWKRSGWSFALFLISVILLAMSPPHLFSLFTPRILESRQRR